jgi:beta-mannanase
MHEMNGNWYPWGGSVNANSAAAYVRAWRRLHGIFRDVGARNVRWVWSPYAEDVPATADNVFERYYPGRAYVDVLALDGYNWGSVMPQHGGWRSFDEIFGRAYRRLARLGPQPIWIAETASAPEGGDKAGWIRKMFASQHRYPRLRAIVWFNVDKERDWRATSPASAAKAFAVRSRRAG